MGNFNFAVVNAGQRNVNVEPELVALTTAGGFRLTGPAAKAIDVKPTDYLMFLHDEAQDAWAIAKGYACKTAAGEYQTCAARIDKKAIVTRDFDAAYEAAMASDNEEVKSALSVDGITRDEQIEILANAMDTPETIKYQGSKTASPSGFTGVGANVLFTDSNVWGQLKSNMDDARSMNRKFALDITEVVEIPVFDGHDNIVVKALVLGDYEDVEPIRRGEE